MRDNIEYRVLGIMSGTSIDGIDFALCTFNRYKKWHFKLEKYQTIKYTNYWHSVLSTLHTKNKQKINRINIEYGLMIAKEAKQFLGKEKVDFISSHGHTIFHQPQNKYTLQIGDGSVIAREAKIKTITNFRTLDISLNGQGAPLVPIGDLYLFSDYKYCVNLGGFANISIKQKDKIIAFDICPVNIILNMICSKLNIEYDYKGYIARKGRIIPELLDKLNKLDFYQTTPPKSLAREWSDKHIIPLIKSYNPKNVLRTFCEHIAIQISVFLKNNSVLFTGGGVFNTFLMERITYHSSAKIIIPSNNIINFKEAIIFGFLGVLRIRNEINCLQSVTGADTDNCGGVIHEL